MALADSTWYQGIADVHVRSLVVAFPDDFESLLVRALVLYGPTTPPFGQSLSTASIVAIATTNGLSAPTIEEINEATATISNQGVFERTMGASRALYIKPEFQVPPYSEGADIVPTQTQAFSARLQVVRGPQGIQGPTGPTGPAGPTGPRGDDGADGATGPAGPAGSDALSGLTSNATNNANIIQAAIDAAQPGDRIRIPAGTWPCRDLQITDKTRIVLEGDGATIQWAGTESSPLSRIGLRLGGTIDGLVVRGLRFVGDGVLANGHAGIFSGSGTHVRNCLIENCHVEDVTLGISFSATSGGSIRDMVVRNCWLDNVIGIDSGYGYGLHFADGTGEPMRLLFEGNHISRAQRHSIYMAMGHGARVIGNAIDLHRDGTTDGAERGAIVCARGGDHAIIGNLITRCNNCAIFLDAGDVADGFTLNNVTVADNVIVDPIPSGFMIPLIEVGESTATPTDDIDQITIVGNTIKTDGYNMSAIRLNWGRGIKVIGNLIRMLNVTAGRFGIELQARGEAAASATYSDDWTIAYNDIEITDGGGGSSSCGIRFNPPFNTDSIVAVDFIGNTFRVPASSFSTSSAVVNPNVHIAGQGSDGLSFSGAVTILGKPVRATTLNVSGVTTLVGDLDMLTPNQAFHLGDGSTAGNIWIEPRKASGNNLTFEQWRVGTAAAGLRWLWQFSSVQDLNLQRYDVNGAFVDTPFAMNWTTGVVTFPQVSITTIVGSMSMLTVGALLIFGDGSTAGNVGFESRKADGNNITWATWRVGTAGAGLRRVEQFDTSENWNTLLANTSGVLDSFTTEQLDYTNRLRRMRRPIGYTLGTTVTNGAFGFVGMGTGAAAAVSGPVTPKDPRGQVTITVGTSPSANPTITFTFVDGTLGAAPQALVLRNGGSGTLAHTWTTTATTLVITLVGTPTAGHTYIFEWRLAG